MNQPNSKYDHEDMKAIRNQSRSSLVDRLNEYVKEVQLEDRRAAQESQWEEAKRLARSSDDVLPVTGLDEVQMQAVDDFLDLLEREARDED